MITKKRTGVNPAKPKYGMLLDAIGRIIETARRNAIKAINTELVKANWKIARHIIEVEQRGKKEPNTEVTCWQGFQRVWESGMTRDLEDEIYFTVDFFCLIRNGRQFLPNSNK